MTIQQAIEKAIEGGYNVGPVEVDMVCDSKYAHHFIDPLFWQSLGKAMGWEEELVIENYDTIAYQYWKGRPQWVFEWHRFIEYLVEGKDVESFFKNL